MKKVQTSGAEYLNKILYQEYKLTISPENAEKIIKKLMHEEFKKANEVGTRSKGFLDRALLAYFATTQLPEDEIINHSCYWYNVFLKKHFYLLILKKDSWLGKMYKLINQLT